MIENDTLVKHKKLGYEGLIDGETRFKILFTGKRECESQYRIKILGQDKRFIAPEEDLVILDEDRQIEMKKKFRKALAATRGKKKTAAVK